MLRVFWRGWTYGLCSSFRKGNFIYNQVMKPVDRAGFGDWRRWATAKAKGRVLEIGAGSGLNFSHYAPEAQVFALDPNAKMLDEMEKDTPFLARVSVLRANAMELPFPARSFDAAVGTLVLCTIPDPGRALAEVMRVLKPGASLRLVEHVRAHNAIFGKLMDAATPLWSRIAGGCHLNRNTNDTVLAAGFEIESIEERWFGLFVGIDARN
jgi:SAM-dependent methyltransferase